jgi:hypothetical protein
VSDFSKGAAASRAARSGTMLRPEQLDDLGNALLLLARELWVVKDRQRVLEALLEANGIVAPNAVTDHQPDAALAAALAAERARYTGALLEVLCPPDEAGA